MGTCKLAARIEMLRNGLNSMIDKDDDLNNYDILNASKNLDEVLNEYYKEVSQTKVSVRNKEEKKGSANKQSVEGKRSSV